MALKYELSHGGGGLSDETKCAIELNFNLFNKEELLHLKGELLFRNKKSNEKNIFVPAEILLDRICKKLIEINE